MVDTTILVCPLSISFIDRVAECEHMFLGEPGKPIEFSGHELAMSLISCVQLGVEALRNYRALTSVGVACPIDVRNATHQLYDSVCLSSGFTKLVFSGITNSLMYNLSFFAQRMWNLERISLTMHNMQDRAFSKQIRDLSLPIPEFNQHMGYKLNRNLKSVQFVSLVPYSPTWLRDNTWMYRKRVQLSRWRALGETGGAVGCQYWMDWSLTPAVQILTECPDSMIGTLQEFLLSTCLDDEVVSDQVSAFLTTYFRNVKDERGSVAIRVVENFIDRRGQYNMNEIENWLSDFWTVRPDFRKLYRNVIDNFNDDMWPALSNYGSTEDLSDRLSWFKKLHYFTHVFYPRNFLLQLDLLQGLRLRNGDDPCLVLQEYSSVVELYDERLQFLIEHFIVPLSPHKLNRFLDDTISSLDGLSEFPATLESHRFVVPVGLKLKLMKKIPCDQGPSLSLKSLIFYLVDELRPGVFGSQTVEEKFRAFDEHRGPSKYIMQFIGNTN